MDTWCVKVDDHNKITGNLREGFLQAISRNKYNERICQERKVIGFMESIGVINWKLRERER